MWKLLVLACTACGRFDFQTVGPIDGGVITDGSAGAPAMVQSTGAVTVVTGNSLVVDFGSAPTTGNTIVVYVATWSGATTSFGAGAVSDNAGNTYAQAVAQTTGGVGSCGSGSLSAAIYYARNIAAPATTFTVNASPTAALAQSISIGAVEYAGLSTTAPLDQTAGHITAMGASPFTFASGTTPLTTSPAEVVFSLAAPCAGAPGFVAWQPDTSGFAVRGVETDTASQPLNAADQLVSAAAKYADSWTITYAGADAPSLGMIATFKP